MKKIIIFVVMGIMFSLFVHGKTSSSNEDEEQALSKADVMETYASIGKEIQKDSEKKPLSYMIYGGYAEGVKSFMSRRFIELDTEIDKSWYESTFKLLEYMAECKQYIHCMELVNKQEDTDYIKWKSNLAEAKKRFQELLKKPTPVEHNKLNKLREEKLKWEAARRKIQVGK